MLLSAYFFTTYLKLKEKVLKLQPRFSIADTIDKSGYLDNLNAILMDTPAETNFS